MNKKEFINAFAKKGKLKLKEAERLVNTFLETVEETLITGSPVRFIGFGIWEVKKKEAREMRNPATGKMIKIPAKKIIKFKVGKSLNEKLK